MHGLKAAEEKTRADGAGPTAVEAFRRAGPPSLREATSFTVRGDVTFEPDFVARGDVVVEG